MLVSDHASTAEGIEVNLYMRAKPCLEGADWNVRREQPMWTFLQSFVLSFIIPTNYNNHRNIQFVWTYRSKKIECFEKAAMFCTEGQHWNFFNLRRTFTRGSSGEQRTFPIGKSLIDYSLRVNVFVREATAWGSGWDRKRTKFRVTGGTITTTSAENKSGGEGLLRCDFSPKGKITLFSGTNV